MIRFACLLGVLPLSLSAQLVIDDFSASFATGPLTVFSLGTTQSDTDVTVLPDIGGPPGAPDLLGSVRTTELRTLGSLSVANANVLDVTNDGFLALFTSGLAIDTNLRVDYELETALDLSLGTSTFALEIENLTLAPSFNLPFMVILSDGVNFATIEEVVSTSGTVNFSTSNLVGTIDLTDVTSVTFLVEGLEHCETLVLDTFTVDIPTVVIPEPATLGLLSLSLLVGLALYRRR